MVRTVPDLPGKPLSVPQSTRYCWFEAGSSVNLHVQMELSKGYTGRPEMITEKTEESGSQLYMYTNS